jgi:hypothetical protein
LSQDEKETLCRRRPVWREKRQSEDINITARYGDAPVIDSFRYFNGLPEGKTVTELIDTILVPDDSEAQWVKRFVADRAKHFGGNIPKVVTFPATGS